MGTDKYEIGQFKSRPNRFVFRVKLSDGRVVKAYCPNTSRLIGLLENKPNLLLTKNETPDRKTNYTVRCIKSNGVWVGIEASKANELFEEYLKNKPDKKFSRWDKWEREVNCGSSQLDFKSSVNGHEHWVEVKSLSSRSNDGSAFYSGTPSKRGVRHLKDLSELAASGKRADCVFVIQRPDVDSLAPNEDITDPGWYSAIKSAHAAGVGIHAYRCVFHQKKWQINKKIPARI